MKTEANDLPQDGRIMSTTSSIISLVLFVALLGCQITAVGSSILSPFWKMESPMCFMSSNTIDTTSDYQRTLQRFRNDGFTRASTRMPLRYDRPFLPNPTHVTQEPVEWITIKQSGWDGDETTLLFRADSMYLVGFANKTGSVFSFKGYHGMIPGSIPIDVGTGYDELVGGWENIHTVPLGRNSLNLALRRFSWFDSSTGDLDHVRKSAAQLIVMFPEALRFFPIRQKIIDGWENDVFLDKEEEKQLLVSWKDICIALIKWDETKEWKPSYIRRKVLNAYNIQNEEDAFRVVDVMLNPRPDPLAGPNGNEEP